MKNVEIPILKFLGLMVGFFLLAGSSLAQSTGDSNKTVIFSENLNNAQVRQNSNPLITLKLNQVSLKAALQRIAGEAEVGLYYNTAFMPEKMVSLHLQALPLDKALRKVLKGTSLRAIASGRNISLRQKVETDLVELPLATAQETITGTVTDVESGETLPGVNILVKGTTTGASTDAEGHFELTVESLQDTLVVSFVGYQTQEVPINGRMEIDITLRAQAITGEEMVVVGYGTQKKANLTGSVSSVNIEQVNKKNVSQASQLLAGEVSGVTVTQGSGNPGKNQATIRIRGLGTFSEAGNSPLVLVDGVPFNINSVNPNNIESISVLKDAASASIYGSRAANGVILITTKEGKVGELQVSYESYIGKQEATELPQYLDSWDFAKSVNIINQNEGRGEIYTEEDIGKFKSRENPERYPNKHFYRNLLNSGNGLQTKHNLTFSGGKEGFRYLFSGGYLRQNGIVKQNSYDRYDMRLNLNSELSDNLRLNIKLFGRESVQEEPGSITENLEVFGGVNSLIRIAQQTNSTIPGKKSDGTYGVYKGHPTSTAELASGSFSERGITNIGSNISFEWDIINSLKFSGRMSYERNFNQNKDLASEFESDPEHIYGPTQLQRIQSNSENLILESLIDYDKTLGGHYLHVLGGYRQKIFNTNRFTGYRNDFQSNELDVLSAGSSAYQTNSETESTWKLRSYFGRINYSFHDKYLLEGNIRYDGSSRFAQDNRYGLFPSFSAGWIISEENFFQIPWIEQFKIRGSYGILGNQQIGIYPYQKVLTSGYPYVFGGEYKDGIVLSRLPSQDIAWETTSVTNLGADINLFEGKLNFNVEYYYKQTYDILYQLTVSKALGMTVGSQNAGEVENRGWNFELNHINTIGEFSYSIRPNFSINNNRVLDLANVEKDIEQGLFVGEPLTSIYGYETEGLFVDQEDVDNYAEQNYNAEPGLPRIKDISGPNGEPDGKVSAEYDRKIIGNEFPKYSYGMGITANYKEFDFYMQVTGQGGMDKQLGYSRLAYANAYNIEKWHLEERWTEENPNRYARYPKFLTPYNLPPWGENLEYWERDPSYLRIKNVQLGYNLPSKIFTNFFVDQFRIYVSGENIYTFDNYYPGWDPQQVAYSYPPTRLWSLGINLQF